MLWPCDSLYIVYANRDFHIHLVFSVGVFFKVISMLCHNLKLCLSLTAAHVEKCDWQETSRVIVYELIKVVEMITILGTGIPFRYVLALVYTCICSNMCPCSVYNVLSLA